MDKDGEYSGYRIEENGENPGLCVYFQRARLGYGGEVVETLFSANVMQAYVGILEMQKRPKDAAIAQAALKELEAHLKSVSTPG